MADRDKSKVKPKVIAAVALYGLKTRPLRELLCAVQEVLHELLGDTFRPYSLEQTHSTLVRLDWFTDSQSGLTVNKRYYDVVGSARPMAPGQALEILCSHLEPPLHIRFGGHQPNGLETFSSRGMSPYQRMFSVQGQACVLVGWPLPTVVHGISRKPLDDLRRKMNDANIMHYYHESLTDIDNDFHIVVGHHSDAPPATISAAVEAVRSYLVKHPAEINVGIQQATIITSDTPTLMPAYFIGRIPEDHVDIMRLFR